MKEKLEDKFPSVEWAYDFVKPSYEWLQKRFDAINSRIEFILTFSSGITLAVPVFSTALYPNVDFGSLWFRLAIAIFILTAIVGIWGRMYGGMKLVDPQKLYDEWLKYSKWEFKKNALYFAGRHFAHNRIQVNRKANFGIAMSILFIMEVILMVIWMATLK